MAVCEMNAGGWRRDCHPGGSRKGGAAPFEPPEERHPALPCRVGEDGGEMESVHLPKPLFQISIELR